MSDTFTTNLKVRLPETGQYFNSWGTTLNSDAIELLDEAIAGQAIVPIGTSTAYSLAAMSQGATSESRMFSLLFAGTPGGAVTVTVPGSVTKKFYLATNATGQAITMKYSASTGAVIADGDKVLLWCDGTEVYAVTSSDAATLNGFTAADFAKIATYNEFTAGFSTPFVALIDQANIQLDCTLSNRFKVTLTANRSMVLLSPHDGQTIEIWVKQDPTGGRLLTWPVNVQFADGIDPGLSTVGNNTDSFRMTYQTDTNLWIASEVLRSPPSAQIVDVHIESNCTDVNVFALAGAPSGPYTVNVTVDVGIVVQALSVTTAAMDLSGFDTGSIVNLTNRGYILGRGGRGGFGSGAAGLFGGPDATWRTGAQLGQAAGSAIKGPGASRTFNVTNAQGQIWGGGGGGGGGGTSIDNGTGNLAGGGGGGGGKGGGTGGQGGTGGSRTASSYVNAGDGIDGGTGVTAAAGAGGAEAHQGSGIGEAGGDGGDWGSAGSAGASITTFGVSTPGATGGGAGKAIDLNGGTVNLLSGGSAPHIIGLVS